MNKDKENFEWNNSLNINKVYEAFKEHADQCKEIIFRYKNKRKQILMIEEKIKNSKFLKWVNSIESTEGFSEEEVNKINFKVAKYEMLLETVRIMTDENIGQTTLLIDQLFYVKVVKRKIQTVNKNANKISSAMKESYAFDNDDKPNENKSDIISCRIKSFFKKVDSKENICPNKIKKENNYLVKLLRPAAYSSSSLFNLKINICNLHENSKK